MRRRGVAPNTAATVAIFFFWGFSALLPPHHPLCQLGLHHGDALAVDGADEDVALGELARGTSVLVEAVDVTGGVDHDLLGAAFGDADPGQLPDCVHGLVERSAHRGPGQVALDLVAEATSRQAQLGVEGVEALMPGSTVADPGDAELAHHGHDAPGVQPLVGKAHPLSGLLQHEGRADVSDTTGVDVRLQRPSADLSDLRDRLPLELVESEASAAGPLQVALQLTECLSAVGGPATHGVKYAT